MRARYPLLILPLMVLAGAASPDAHHWAYAGKEGPSHWGGTCSTGKAQSPIDISKPRLQWLAPVRFELR